MLPFPSDRPRFFSPPLRRGLRRKELAAGWPTAFQAPFRAVQMLFKPMRCPPPFSLPVVLEALNRSLHGPGRSGVAYSLRDGKKGGT